MAFLFMRLDVVVGRGRVGYGEVRGGWLAIVVALLLSLGVLGVLEEVVSMGERWGMEEDLGEFFDCRR